MASTIKVRRKDFIDQLSGIKHDNIGIADVVINRQKLIQALKLQTQPQADVLTIAYGTLAWQADGSKGSNDLEPEPCISFSCDHTVMRFLNRPKQVRYGQEPKIKYLNFIDHAEPKPELTGIPLDPQELLKALSFVLPCVATEQTRPVLNCVLLGCGDDTIKLVAGDGYRLGIATIPADGIPQDKILIHPADLITFLKSIKPVGKGKSKHYPEVYMTPDYGKVKFAYIGGGIELDKQAYTFPDYTQLIPKDGPDSIGVRFIASQVLVATRSLNAIAKDGSGIIRLQFQASDNKMTLSAKSNTHDGDNDSAIECDSKVDADCKIAVNTKYLIDLLRLCGDNIVDMRLTVPSAPMTFNMGGDKQQVIMPMFVQWGDKSINNKDPEDLDEESAEPTPEEIDETISEPDEVLAGV